MGKIILAKAGATDFEEQDRIVGNLDVPISVRGQAELTEMARDLADQEIGTIYCSVGESARESARYLGQQLGVKVRVMDELRNVDFGLWQGLPVNEVRRKHPRAFKQWESSPCAVCPPAGEMMDEVVDRVRKALKSVCRKASGGNVLLVVPDPLRQVIRCQLLQCDLAHLLDSPNGGNWELIEVA